MNGSEGPASSVAGSLLPQHQIDHPAPPRMPAYWLLDTAGKIVAKAHDPDELVPEFEKRLK